MPSEMGLSSDTESAIRSPLRNSIASLENDDGQGAALGMKLERALSEAVASAIVKAVRDGLA